MATGCVGGQGEQSELTGSDAHEDAPPEAQDVIIKGLETMFTWFPARDTSPLDAYNRALPFLGQAFRDGANNKLERGNSVWWQDWKAKKAEVTADALLVDAEHPEDTPDTVQRAVVLTQTVKAPDGKQLDSSTMQVDRVVAKKSQRAGASSRSTSSPRTSSAPRRRLPTGGVAPAASRRPVHSNPPPPPKQCPDGSTVAPDQVCPPPKTGPQTKQCPDRTTVPATATCPGPTTSPTSCDTEDAEDQAVPGRENHSGGPNLPTTTGPTTTQCPDDNTRAHRPNLPNTPNPPRCPDASGTIPAEPHTLPRAMPRPAPSPPTNPAQQPRPPSYAPTSAPSPPTNPAQQPRPRTNAKAKSPPTMVGAKAPKAKSPMTPVGATPRRRRNAQTAKSPPTMVGANAPKAKSPMTPVGATPRPRTNAQTAKSPPTMVGANAPKGSPR